MLKKLLKYDLINCFKGIIVFYVLAFIFSSLTRIFNNINYSTIFNIIGSICSGCYVSMIFSIFINNSIRLWVKYKNSFYGDESYLIHTLPITKNTLYLSKILTSIISLLVSFIVIFITLFIAYYSVDSINYIKDLLFNFSSMINISSIRLVIIFFIVLFLEFINLLQIGFTGVILGHKMDNKRTLFSFIYSFISYSILQLIIVIFMLICGLFNNDIMSLFTSNNINNISVFNTVMIISIIGYTLTFIMNYLFNIKMFNKGVNVE